MRDGDRLGADADADGGLDAPRDMADGPEAPAGVALEIDDRADRNVGMLDVDRDLRPLDAHDVGAWGRPVAASARGVSELVGQDAVDGPHGFNLLGGG